MDYKITPVAVDGAGDADGVYENEYGAWLGLVDWQETESATTQIVLPYSDEDGDYIPAPANWRDLIVAQLG